MKLKSASEYERRIRILKRENAILDKTNKTLAKENRNLFIKIDELEKQVEKLTDTGNYAQGM